MRRPPPLVLPNGRLRNPIAFGGATGPLRLFESRLADQGAWMLPLALLGLLAFGLLILAGPPAVGPLDMPFRVRPRGYARTGAGERTRRDPRLATLIVLGGWLLAEAAILSFSGGIVHPYYISAVAPGAAAMIGAGAVAFARFARDRDLRVVLLPLAVIATVATQLSILNHQHYMRWFIPVLIVGATICASTSDAQPTSIGSTPAPTRTDGRTEPGNCARPQCTPPENARITAA